MKILDGKIFPGEGIENYKLGMDVEHIAEFLNDTKITSALRGEILRDINQIHRKNIRVPSGYEMAHRRGYEARKGYGYEYSDLNTIENHKRQHKIDGYGRKGK